MVVVVELADTPDCESGFCGIVPRRSPLLGVCMKTDERQQPDQTLPCGVMVASPTLNGLVRVRVLARELIKKEI